MPRFPEQRKLLLRIMKTVEQYHVLDDPGALCFGLAVGASADLDGPPLWGMLVAPPSGGKTEAVELTHDVAVEHLDDVTVAGLLSWYHPSNGKGEAMPVGTLIRVGETGLITIADFSTVLKDSQRGRGGRDDLYSIFRRIFDGEVQRDLGNELRPLRWKGRVTFLAACTAVIDHFASHSDALGPRWLYFRPKARDRATRRAITHRALRVNASEQKAKKAVAQSLAGRLIRNAGPLASEATLDDTLMHQIGEAALVVCMGRASVPRDSYGEREINGPVEMEEPPRVAKQLLMQARCLIGLGLDDREAMAVMTRSAIDSMPAMRAGVLRAVVTATEPVTTASVAKACGVDWKVANRYLMDFQALGVLAQAEITNRFAGHVADGKPWVLDHPDADTIRAVFECASHPVLPELNDGGSDEVSTS